VTEGKEKGSIGLGDARNTAQKKMVLVGERRNIERAPPTHKAPSGHIYERRDE